MSIRVIAGLGNPGKEYSLTRHNAGWMLLDAYAAKRGAVWKFEAKFNAEVATLEGVGGGKLYLIKPQTYMNLSGESLGAFLHFYKILPEGLLVIHDEVAFDAGSLKLSYAGSAGGHNGIGSIINAVGGEGFWRLRLGVGPRLLQWTLAEFVLSELPQEARNGLKSEKILDILALIIDKGPKEAQNSTNQNITKYG